MNHQNLNETFLPSRTLRWIALSCLMAACSSSPFYHKVFMRGQIVGVDDDQVVFCIGKETGASIGEEFVAYRYTFDGDTYEEGETYHVVKAGTVVVRQIVNEHFAKGVVLNGEVIESDVLFAN